MYSYHAAYSLVCVRFILFHTGLNIVQEVRGYQQEHLGGLPVRSRVLRRFHLLFRAHLMAFGAMELVLAF